MALWKLYVSVHDEVSPPFLYTTPRHSESKACATKTFNIGDLWKLATVWQQIGDALPSTLVGSVFLKYSRVPPCPKLFQILAKWQWQPVLDSVFWALEKHTGFRPSFQRHHLNHRPLGESLLYHTLLLFLRCTRQPVRPCFPGSDNHWAMARRQIRAGILFLRRKKKSRPNRLAVSHPWGLAMPHTKWFLSKQPFFRFRQVLSVAPQLTKVSGSSTLFLNLLI